MGRGRSDGGGRVSMLGKLKHHVELYKDKYSTVEDVVQHLQVHHREYSRMGRRNLTPLVQKLLRQAPSSKQESQRKRKREGEDLFGSNRKKEKCAEGLQNDYSKRKKNTSSESEFPSELEDLSSASSSSYGETGDGRMEEVSPKIDLLRSMLRESYSPAAKPKGKAVGRCKDLTGDGRMEEVEVKGKAGPRFRDLGGLRGILEQLEMEVLLPLYHPHVPQKLGVDPIGGILLHGPPGCGKTTLAHAIANEVGIPFYKISAPEVVSGSPGASEEVIRELFSEAYRTAPSIIFIDEIDVIASKRENLDKEMERRIVAQLMTCMDSSSYSKKSDQKPGHVLVIGATNRPDAVDAALRRPGRFDREIRLGAPDENGRVDILSKLTQDITLEGSLHLLHMARATPGFVGADLKALVNQACVLAMRRSVTELKMLEETEKLAINMADFEEAAKTVQPSSRREGFSTIPNVTWEDVVGLQDIRDTFEEDIVRPIKFPEVYQEMGLKGGTGILLYGPPGCGKTLIAKAAAKAANEAGANFIHIKGLELLSKYDGESELEIPTLFSRARTCSPCVIFFDEVDALTAKRGSQGGWAVLSLQPRDTKSLSNKSLSTAAMSTIDTNLDNTSSRKIAEEPFRVSYGLNEKNLREKGDNLRSLVKEGLTSKEVEKVRQLLKGTDLYPQETTGITSHPLCLSAQNHGYGNTWLVDSGASHHMTHNIKLFLNYTPCSSDRKVVVANGTLANVAGTGSIQITHDIVLMNVLHVPKLSSNLISVHKLTKDLKCYATFFPTCCIFHDLNTKKSIGLAKGWNGLYQLETGTEFKDKTPTAFVSLSNKETILLHHLSLGHPAFKTLKILFPSLFLGLDIAHLHCDTCELAKHSRVSFPISNKRSSQPFQLIHSDVWGPSVTPNLSGAKWFITFIDDCTRVTWTYLLKHKSDVSTIIPMFHSMIQNQFETKIKYFRSDNAKDYFNNTLSSFFQSQGIIHESSCVYTPQQNGVAERKNRHLLDTTRALLIQGNVPNSYWGEAVLTSTYLINRLPSSVLDNKSPIAVLKSFYPNFRSTNDLKSRIFGCTAFVHIHQPLRNKLEPRAIKCIFIGYSSTQKGYKCYDPNNNKILVSADVTFSESTPFFHKEQTPITYQNSNSFEFLQPLDLPPNTTTVSVPTLTQESILFPDQPQPIIDTSAPRFTQVYSRRKTIPNQQVQNLENPNYSPQDVVAPDQTSNNPIDDNDLPIAIRKGTRECTKTPLYPLSNFISLEHLSPSHKHFITSLHAISIPNSVFEALTKKEWRDAMEEEMRALKKNGTWEVVNKPKGHNIVGCKWVYTVKYKADGSLERYKARLVAKGYTQTYGIDYQETFAPVAKMNTVRILLSLAAHYNLSLLQYDVKNAFLHGELDDEIYMSIPPGFEDDEGDKVCKLKKALYGLKQSPRAWFGKFSKAMKVFGYKQSQGDHTLFIKQSVAGRVTILLVYVDDIIVTGDDEKGKEELKQKLISEFELKELGRLKYFLGIEVAYSSQGIFISQQKYVVDLLKETGKSGCKPSSTPIDFNHKLGEAKEAPTVDKKMYQQLVGKLIYLSHTRPDIAFSVSIISQFMHDPRLPHLQAAYRVLHYLKGSPGKGILYKRGSKLTLEGYTDADYAGSHVDRRSTTGYCTFLGGNLITWRSKKQNVVARSSAESEFRAISLGLCELLWLKIILDDLGIKFAGPIKLYSDNKSAISIAHNPVQHDRTKHIEIDRHFIKEKLEEGLVSMTYVPSASQLADVLTKGLHTSTFNGLVSKLGMTNIYSAA